MQKVLDKQQKKGDNKYCKHTRWSLCVTTFLFRCMIISVFLKILIPFLFIPLNNLASNCSTKYLRQVITTSSPWKDLPTKSHVTYWKVFISHPFVLFNTAIIAGFWKFLLVSESSQPLLVCGVIIRIYIYNISVTWHSTGQLFCQHKSNL